MALEDSEQKYNLLHSVFTDLEDLSLIFETDDLIQSIQELSGQVATLQQQIVEDLPHIQQVADVSGFPCPVHFTRNCPQILWKHIRQIRF